MKPCGQPSKVSPVEAKAIWDSMKRPSARRVVLALNQAGHKVSRRTIQVWQQNGWRRILDPIYEPERSELDAAVPVLTGDPHKRLDSLKPVRDPPARAMTDEERIACGLRGLADCAVMVMDVLKETKPRLVIAELERIGALLERIGNALVAATRGLATLHELRAVAATDITPPGAGAQDEVPPHPLAGMLSAIRKARTEHADR